MDSWEKKSVYLLFHSSPLRICWFNSMNKVWGEISPHKYKMDNSLLFLLKKIISILFTPYWMIKRKVLFDTWVLPISSTNYFIRSLSYFYYLFFCTFYKVFLSLVNIRRRIKFSTYPSNPTFIMSLFVFGWI